MRLFTLSPRLAAVAGLLSHGEVIWDVGSDHAMLPVWLLSTGKAERAVVSDIGRQPLENGRRTAGRFGVEDRISFLLCDGLRGAAPKFDRIVIAGMGGDTIAEILSRSPWSGESGVRMILQPMTSVEELRRYLYSNSYTITGELLVKEGRRLYVIIQAEGGGKPESCTEAELRVGRYINEREYLVQQRNRLLAEQQGATGADRERLNQAAERLSGRLEEK